MLNPLMREARWYFLIGIALGIGGLFFVETPDGRELLLRGSMGLMLIVACIAIYLVISNVKLTNE
ncbi:MAG: hypothetical protein AAB555_02825 [Patescibacteria group bacterium]